MSIDGHVANAKWSQQLTQTNTYCAAVLHQNHKPKRKWEHLQSMQEVEQNWGFRFNIYLTFLYNIGRGFKKFQQKINLPLEGTELTTPTITRLEVWCSSNSANFSFQASLRLSDPHIVMLYSIYKWSIWLPTQWWSVLWVQFTLEATLFFAEIF